MTRTLMLASALLVLAGCRGGAAQPQAANGVAMAATAVHTVAPSPPTAPRPPTSPPGNSDTAERRPDRPAPVRYRVEVRTSDSATADFAEVVRRVLGDRRGWARAGFAFVRRPRAPYLIVLAEGSEVDELCRPLETRSTYSCQNGPVVALNADRWRTATPTWTADLASYRVMLVNHEVGHLLHLHHPKRNCPAARRPAPVMAQQSTELGACRANPWPLRWEIELAAARREPLAPPATHDTADHRPTPPRVQR